MTEFKSAYSSMTVSVKLLLILLSITVVLCIYCSRYSHRQ